MKVVEIFQSVQGEGLLSGAPMVFVRFGGCTLRCQECDTEYAQNTSSLLDVGAPFITDKILEICSRPRYICITGGEPLEQPQTELFNLFQILQSWHGTRGLERIILETNGARNIDSIRNTAIRRLLDFSIDFKTPSTGKHDNMIFNNFIDLRRSDLIKFVCKDLDDIRFAGSVLGELAKKQTCQATVWFHMIGGKPDKGLAQEILKWEGLLERFDIRCGIQLHKIFQLR